MEESLEKSFKFCPVTGICIPLKDVQIKDKIPHMREHMEWVSKNSDSLVKDTEPSPLVQIVSRVLAKCPHDQVMRTREKNVQWFRGAVQRHGDDRYIALSDLDEHVRDVLSSVGELPVHLPLLSELTDVLEIEGGHETVRDLAEGFPLVGPGRRNPYSPFGATSQCPRTSYHRGRAAKNVTYRFPRRSPSI